MNKTKCITLERVKNVSRDATGNAWAWTHTGKVVKSFDSVIEALDYLENNELDENTIFFSGSASNIDLLNAELGKKLR